MTEQQQARIDSLQRERQRLAKKLDGGAAAKANDAAEVSYALCCKQIEDLLHEFGNAGYMGVRRKRHLIGVS